MNTTVQQRRDIIFLRKNLAELVSERRFFWVRKFTVLLKKGKLGVSKNCLTFYRHVFLERNPVLANLPLISLDMFHNATMPSAF